jgi:hypothetical protein
VDKFVLDAFNEAEVEYGCSKHPVSKIYVCLSEPLNKKSHLPQGFQRTVVEDGKRGVFVVYISCAQVDYRFYSQIGYGVFHVLYPDVSDTYAEGLAMLFGRDMSLQSGHPDPLPDQSSDQSAGATELALGMDLRFSSSAHTFRPFRLHAQSMIQAIRSKIGVRKTRLLMTCLSRDKHGTYVNVNQWLSLLSNGERQDAIKIIRSHTEEIEQSIPPHYRFELPSNNWSLERPALVRPIK